MASPSTELKALFAMACDTPGDIHEHVPELEDLAAECAREGDGCWAELGVRAVVSAWGSLHGLARGWAERYAGGSAEPYSDDRVAPALTLVDLEFHPNVAHVFRQA